MNRAATWSRQPLAELTRSLTAVCMGREPADLIITAERHRGLVDGVTFTLVPPLVE
jgi:hypothetical protein